MIDRLEVLAECCPLVHLLVLFDERNSGRIRLVSANEGVFGSSFFDNVNET